MNKYIWQNKKSPILFIPGGPWICGDYVSKDFYPINGHQLLRYTHFNHEFLYDKSLLTSFSDNVDNIVKFIKEIEHDEIVIIGHSYGALLIAYLIKENLIPSRKKIFPVLVSVPLTEKKSEQFESWKLNNPSGHIIKNIDFKRRWSVLIDIYTHSLSASKFLKEQDVYWEGNENLNFLENVLLETQEFIIKEHDFFKFIYGSSDPLINLGTYGMIRDCQISGCAHFPMLENPELFTVQVNNLFLLPTSCYTLLLTF